MTPRKKKHKKPASTYVTHLVNTLASLKAPLPCPTEILRTARVSDNVPEHLLAHMTEEDACMVEAGRQAGCHLVHVYWHTGQSALMFCSPGNNMPPPHLVVQAYERNVAQSMNKRHGAQGEA